MADRITHRAFFGETERPFTLTDPMLAELERLTGQGTGAIYAQIVGMTCPARTLTEIIRLGLIGAGMAPEEAMRLCTTYAHNRPLTEILPLAFGIMDARWSGVEATT
ncbi:gene transfer agent family protein [Phaeovulum vinaykumarii]|uniref:Phage tail tube protein, GTA-gp10 n=1 Tax=Phaeovulum vinaykumarii TaxID=407234 RepID=A0A1N7K668_9RHOB|nr:gene transfer agent family protein [Phaeovulum vinaykumarii]SIS57037.1 Phage tail tube protein, GTA-gp10 [Phaeovulum vinaykumarii]SOB93242.1 tail tube GTA-gp10-like protein [Phaeovulum vinaykumarii]